MKLETYDEVKKHLLGDKTRNLSLLIGNGFSISYAPNIFSYNALSKFIENNQDEDLKSLFGIIKTSNFEQIMSELDLFIKILNVFDPNSQLKEKIDSLSGKLKTMLIKAYEEINTTIKKVHPAFKTKITPENISNIREAVISAMAYWYNHNLNAKADAGNTESAVDTITSVINKVSVKSR